MAYFSQEMKKEIAPQVKKVLKKHNVKATVSVRNHSTLVVTLISGQLEFIKNNGHRACSWHYDQNPQTQMFLQELEKAMNGKGSKIRNHNNSDITTDYHDVGWYVDISVGKHNKDYTLS